MCDKNRVEEKTAVHSFAVKYYDMFNDPKVDYLQLENDLGKECGDQGFDMDAGESFIKEYSGKHFIMPRSWNLLSTKWIQ